MPWKSAFGRHARLGVALACLFGAFAAPAQEQVLRVIAMPTLAEIQEPMRGGSTQGLSVDESLLNEWRLRRDLAIEQGATIIVFELTTPGGRLDICQEFIRDLQALRSEGIRVAAFIPEEALSAGALIALAPGELFMAPGARIGNAIPISFRGFGEITEQIPAKAQSMVNSIAGSLTATGIYNELIVRSMTNPDLEIWSERGSAGGLPRIINKEDLPNSERIERHGLTITNIVRAGEAFTLTAKATDRLTLGDNFPYTMVNTRDDLPRALGLGDRDLESSEVLKIDVPQNAISLGRELLGNVEWVWLLAIAGIVFFFMELKTPGLGIFGVASILSLVAFFALTSESGPPVYLPIGLLLLGFLLLFAEIFIVPGFGLAGVAGMVLVFGSVYTATVGLPGDNWQDQLMPNSSGDWVIVKAWALTFLTILICSVAGALFLARNLDKLPIFKHAFIKPPVLEPVLAGAAPSGVTAFGTVKVALGKRGRATTDCRPSGHAEFDVGVVDVVSDGGYIRMGQAIEVVLVEGSRVVVAPVEEDLA